MMIKTARHQNLILNFNSINLFSLDLNYLAQKIHIMFSIILQSFIYNAIKPSEILLIEISMCRLFYYFLLVY